MCGCVFSHQAVGHKHSSEKSLPLSNLALALSLSLSLSGLPHSIKEPCRFAG